MHFFGEILDLNGRHPRHSCAAGGSAREKRRRQPVAVTSASQFPDGAQQLDRDRRVQVAVVAVNSRRGPIRQTESPLLASFAASGVGDAHGVNGLGQIPAKRSHLVSVGLQRLLDAVVDLSPRITKGNDSGKVRQVRAPTTVLGLFEDYDVFAHRRCSGPLAFRMLESVPTGMVWLFPATTMRPASPGRPHTSSEPRWRRTSHPASRSASLTSRYFLGTLVTVRPKPDASEAAVLSQPQWVSTESAAPGFTLSQ